MSIKIAVYYRRSTDKQETSIEQQRRAVEAYAKNNSYEIVCEYIDTGSGKTAERKDFLRMIADGTSRSRDFETILTYDISRFGRMDTDEVGFYRHQLKANGVSIIYVAEGLRNDNSMGDRIVKGVKQEMAHEYSKDMAQKIIRGLISHSERGFASGRMASFGFVLMEVKPDGSPEMVHDEKGKLVPKILRHELKERKGNKNNSVKLTPGDPKDVETANRIFKMSDDGFDVRDICTILNKEGIPSPGRWKRKDGLEQTVFERGKWFKHTVWAILRNPVYKGTLIWNRSRNIFREKYEWKRENGNIIVGEKRLKNSSLPRTRDEKEWIVCENAHEAIIEPELFDRVQIKLGKRSNNGGKRGNGQEKYLLAGVFFCGNCNSSLRPDVDHKKATKENGRRTEKTYRYYRCSGHADKAICAKGITADMDRSEENVWSVVEKRLHDRGIIERAIEKAKKMNETALGHRPNRLKEIESEKRKITTKIDRLLDAVEKGEELDLLKERLTKHKNSLKEFELEESELSEFKIDLSALEKEYVRIQRNFNQVAKTGSKKDRREVVKVYIDKAVANWKEGTLDVYPCDVPKFEISERLSVPSLANFCFLLLLGNTPLF